MRDSGEIQDRLRLRQSEIKVGSRLDAGEIRRVLRRDAGEIGAVLRVDTVGMEARLGRDVSAASDAGHVMLIWRSRDGEMHSIP